MTHMEFVSAISYILHIYRMVQFTCDVYYDILDVAHASIHEYHIFSTGLCVTNINISEC